MGSIWSFLTPKGRCRPCARNEYDLNCWDGNISTFSDRFFYEFPGQGTILTEETQR